MDNTDVVDAIANPESSLYSAITDAINVLKDKVILQSAIRSVKVGGRTIDESIILEITRHRYYVAMDRN